MRSPLLHTPMPLAITALLLAGCGTVERAETTVADLPTARYTLAAGGLTGPDTLTAGATLVELVAEDGVLDQVTLVRMADGRTIAEFLAAAEVTYPPFWAAFAGGPGGALPGAPSRSVVTLTPGQWLALAFDTGPDGFPRLRHRAVRALTVIPGDGRTPPAPTGALQLFDYGFLLAAPLVAGAHLLEVVNSAPQRHEVIVVRLPAGIAAEEMAEWLLAYRRGEAVGTAPAEIVGGVAALSQSQGNLLPLTLQAGRYALLCLLADDGDGRSHLAHGHLQTIEVVESVQQMRPDSG